MQQEPNHENHLKVLIESDLRRERYEARRFSGIDKARAGGKQGRRMRMTSKSCFVIDTWIRTTLQGGLVRNDSIVQNVLHVLSGSLVIGEICAA